MRLNYVSSSSESLSPEDRQIHERIKLRRQPGDLLPLDRALLHSPRFADGKFVPNLRIRLRQFHQSLSSIHLPTYLTAV